MISLVGAITWGLGSLSTGAQGEILKRFALSSPRTNLWRKDPQHTVRSDSIPSDMIALSIQAAMRVHHDELLTGPATLLSYIGTI